MQKKTRPVQQDAFHKCVKISFHRIVTLIVFA
jgi:hypothetical protein